MNVYFEVESFNYTWDVFKETHRSGLEAGIFAAIWLVLTCFLSLMIGGFDFMFYTAVYTVVIMVSLWVGALAYDNFHRWKWNRILRRSFDPKDQTAPHMIDGEFLFWEWGDRVDITIPNSGMEPLRIEFQGVGNDFGLIGTVIHDFNSVIRWDPPPNNGSSKNKPIQISSNVLKYMDVKNVDMRERKLKERRELRDQIIQEKNKNSEYNRWMDRIQSEMKSIYN